MFKVTVAIVLIVYDWKIDKRVT